jgi:DNA (cytosine-5)-methyltransferase 1
MYTAIDLFAGIGGIRLGFEKGFDDIETVFVSEIDSKSQQTYKDNFKYPINIKGDITKIKEEDIPAFDICLAGFPCQAFSYAGKKEGFNDKIRGTLFLDVVRICEYHKPKVIFCENVKGLVNHDKGKTLAVILSAFEQIGYNVYYKVLNSKDYGVPQNRERIYIVAFRKDIISSDFKFPEPLNQNIKLEDIIEKDKPDNKYWLSQQYVDTLKKHKLRHENKGNGFGYKIRELNDIAGAIVCGGMGREKNLIIDKRLNDFAPVGNRKTPINNEYIRTLTPREWARLQGFPEEYKFNCADTVAYKQLGNSVSIPVIKEISKEIKNILQKNEKGCII